ncbi:cell division protein SepF [Micromonospora acroterricola]|uniref:Cell division protein SepF n=1 Tax=Micromonospora acroterricola TaxID=2202421 RepID=A0A317D282_9ACTN|nr:cell division protein SepF [Micromonospora acroterricola]PWR08829.1 cell division protein SepF [Micromonospora acroterricola]
MGALRKAGVWLGLVEEDDERAYDDGGYDKGGYRDSRYRQSRYSEEFADEDDDDTEEPPAPRSRASERGRLSERSNGRAGESDRGDNERSERAERASVRSITRSSAGETSGALTYHTRDNLALAPQVTPRERAMPEEEQRYQITTLHPTTYREARTIGEHFRDGVPVIINLTEMDEADARRLVDFAAGLAFGLRGTIERVTNRVFLLSPANVQVTAEDKAKIAEGGFFSLS